VKCYCSAPAFLFFDGSYFDVSAFLRFVELRSPLGGLFSVTLARLGGFSDWSFLFVSEEKLRAGDPGLGTNDPQR